MTQKTYDALLADYTEYNGKNDIVRLHSAGVCALDDLLSSVGKASFSCEPAPAPGNFIVKGCDDFDVKIRVEGKEEASALCELLNGVAKLYDEMQRRR